ncbi:hypothetical protein J4219_07725 [Candidatus Woesearchaeota archaeon]|nr:hypothetical protein [Candidatus Woesearchaeota archaeon]
MELNEYEKIVIISTLAQPMSLHDISKAWYGHKTRLYHITARKKLDEAVKRGTLLKEGKNEYRANTTALLKKLIEEIGLGEEPRVLKEYRALLSLMYGNLGGFSHKAYLGFEAVQSLAKRSGKLSVHRGLDLDLKLVLQLPFILELMEYENPTLKNLLVQLLNLEEYEKTIGKLELQYLPILQEQRKQDEWSRTGDKMAALLPKLQKKGIGLVGVHKGGQK